MVHTQCPCPHNNLNWSFSRQKKRHSGFIQWVYFSLVPWDCVSLTSSSCNALGRSDLKMLIHSLALVLGHFKIVVQADIWISERTNIRYVRVVPFIQEEAYSEDKDTFKPNLHIKISKNDFGNKSRELIIYFLQLCLEGILNRIVFICFWVVSRNSLWYELWLVYLSMERNPRLEWQILHPNLSFFPWAL